MGYYTDYSLSAEWYGNTSEPSQEEVKKLQDEIEKMNVFDSEGDITLGWWANVKWYDWEEDMAMLSKRFPGFLFSLNGNGESPDDIWGVYFINGYIMRDARSIVTKPFDIKKLTPASIHKDNRYSYQEVEW